MTTIDATSLALFRSLSQITMSQFKHLSEFTHTFVAPTSGAASIKLSSFKTFNVRDEDYQRIKMINWYIEETLNLRRV